MANAKEMAACAVAALEEKKADDIKIINIEEVSTIADYFIIAGGSNKNQIQALVDETEEKLHELGADPKQIEGYRGGGWVLMDYGDIVIHIFDKENRLFYDLERVWRDGTQVDKESLMV